MVFIHWNGFHRMQLVETDLFLNKLHSANKIYIDINGHWLLYCNVMCIKVANCANISNEGGKKMSPQVEWFNSIHLIYSFKSHSALSCAYSRWEIFSRKWLYMQQCRDSMQRAMRLPVVLIYMLVFVLEHVYTAVLLCFANRKCCYEKGAFRTRETCTTPKWKKNLWNCCLFALKQQNHRNKYNLSEFH